MKKSILIIILLLLFCDKQRNYAHTDFYNCPESILGTPTASHNLKSRIFFAFQCYYIAKGDDEKQTYSMNLFGININNIMSIRSTITIYSDTVSYGDKGPFYMYWQIKDSILSESKINNIIKYLNDNNICCLKCIKGYTTTNRMGNEIYFFYYNKIKDTNVVWFSDRENKLLQPEIVGLKSIFNRKDIFKYTKADLDLKYKLIIDSLKNKNK
jgi:hypothetical protein